MSNPFAQVHLSCSATAGGETITVQQVVAPAVYEDEVARPLIEKHLREELIRAILEKWTPVVKVRRG